MVLIGNSLLTIHSQLDQFLLKYVRHGNLCSNNPSTRKTKHKSFVGSNKTAIKIIKSVLTIP